MGSKRLCSKTACTRLASATLTYNYADSTVVVGPLSQRAEPHALDLCVHHAESLTAPVGWELIRIGAPEETSDPDDLLAIAEALSRDEPVDEPLTPDASSRNAEEQPIDRTPGSTTSRPETISPTGAARPTTGPQLRVVRHSL